MIKLMVSLLSFLGLLINFQDVDLLSLAESALSKPSPTLFKIKEEITKNNPETKKADVVESGKGIKVDMVLIPAGKFNPYYMGKYEVTQEQWQSVMGNNPSSRTTGAKLPVTDVSWEDCQEFIKKLNAKTNGGYRLPTEAEWEYACSAGTTTEYPFGFGDRPTDSAANVRGESIKAVGSYKANGFGLYDMHGNVSEWCEDLIGQKRVQRGGSFLFTESAARSSNRFGNKPSDRLYYGGFRLARTP